VAYHGTRAKYKQGCRCAPCKEANRQYHAKYRLHNHNRVLEHNRAWRSRNPDRDQEYYRGNREVLKRAKKQYAEEHSDEKKAYEIQYYQENADEIKARSRAWEVNNRPRRREIVRKTENTRRARKLNQFVEDIDPQIVFERDEGICGICDTAVIGKFHVDHIIPLAKGGLHTYGNVQTAHPTCNLRKGPKLQEEVCQIR
jgi:5-methylcytosine-specific restriction endonuclease McrA